MIERKGTVGMKKLVCHLSARPVFRTGCLFKNSPEKTRPEAGINIKGISPPEELIARQDYQLTFRIKVSIGRLAGPASVGPEVMLFLNAGTDSTGLL